jgi:hypothetical protein
MLTDLPMTILIFLASLVLTVSVLIYLFLWKCLLSSVWWKRSDYVYFVSTIIAAILIIINTSSNRLQSELLHYKSSATNSPTELKAILFYT